jgi:hypothetical protein
MRPFRTLYLSLALATLAGCALFSRGSRSEQSARRPGYREPAPEYVYVSVANHNWSDVVVELYHNGLRTRIGQVTAASDARLRFPSRFVAGSLAVRLIAKPIGSPEGLVSEQFVVHPGQNVEWTLESGLGRSSLAVY